MSIRETDKLVVCRYCLRYDFDVIKHGQMFGTSDPETPETVCVWPCNHEVADRFERGCPVCNPSIVEDVFA